MKLRVPNELFFTVFFGKENASKRMRDIFEEFYGNANEAFTDTHPKEIYDSEAQEKYERIVKWN